MKALVTGGTGFIGSHVARKLVTEKVSVRCLIRDSSKRANLAGLDVDYVTGDLTDAASLKRALQGCDTLFHVAADYRLWAPKPEEMDRINVEGTRDLLRAAADAGVKKIVYTSSVAAVGRPQTNGHLGIGTEALDPTPAQLVGPYKRSKFLSDKLVRDFAQN